MTRPPSSTSTDDPTRADPSVPSLTNVTQRDISPAGTGVLRPETRVAGRYLVRRFVGSGGCGEVYEVFDERTRRVVALKLNRQTQGDPWAAAALRGEFAVLATLHHPSLADVFDFGRLGDAAFFTQALVPGVHFDRAGLKLEDAIDLVMQLCRALAYLHARGLLHRDVKPPNVLVDPAGDRLVLLDFGIAQSFGTGPHATVVGTPTYVAPEAVRGQPLDARSDLYSLGVLLYKLASGSVPFPARGRTSDEVYWDQLATAPPPLPSTVPAPLAAIVMRLLEKEPADRFASAGEVIEALAAATQRRATGETPETLASYVLSASFVDPGHVLASAENACRAESPAPALALVGEAGSGKSRLLRELRHRLQMRGAPWFAIQTRTNGASDALVHDIATRVLTTEVVQALDAQDRIELVRIVPTLRRRGERIAIPSDIERSRQLGIVALARAIAAGFGSDAGVIAIDDLHRADEATASQLVALVEASIAAGARCTFLVSGRPSPAMSTFARVRPIALGTALLDEAGCRELVRATFGDADLLVGTALADAFRQAPRAALWVQESLRLAADRGQVVRRHARFERIADVPALEPEALFDARVMGLPASARGLALTCAIWAMPATVSELARASGMRAAPVGSALRELVRAGIAEEERDVRGHVTYAVHDRFADVVPRSFSPALVLRAHERAARAHTRPELAARHLSLAGDASGARSAYLEAAREAEKSGQPTVALQWVDAAIRAAPDDVAIGDHLLRHDVAVTCGARDAASESLAWLVAREDGASPTAQIEIRLRVARRAVTSGEADRGRAAAADALTLAERAGDSLAAARAHRITAEAEWLFGSIDAAKDAYERAASLATVGDEAARAFIGASLAAIHLGRTREGLSAARNGVRAAAKSDDLALRSDAQRQLGNVTRELGQSARARTYYRLAVRSARDAGCLEREGKALNNLGTVEHWLGDAAAGLEAFERSIALKERAGATASALLGYNNLAALRNALGQWAHSRVTLDRIMKSPAADLALARPIALSNVGDLEIATGRLDEAIEAYGEGVSLCRERSLVMQQTHGLANLSRALWMRDADGDRARADACLTELEDLSRRHDIAEVQRRLHAARSISASMAGRERDALREARAAVRVRDRHTRFSDLFHTPIEVRWILALALARAGNAAEAARHAARAQAELYEIADMVDEPAMRASYLLDHPLHAAIGGLLLDLPLGWTWRKRRNGPS